MEKESSNVMVPTVDSEGDSLVREILFVSGRRGEESWVLYSGATFHMPQHKS